MEDAADLGSVFWEFESLFLYYSQRHKEKKLNVFESLWQENSTQNNCAVWFEYLSKKENKFFYTLNYIKGNFDLQYQTSPVACFCIAPL